MPQLLPDGVGSAGAAAMMYNPALLAAAAMAAAQVGGGPGALAGNPAAAGGLLVPPHGAAADIKQAKLPTPLTGTGPGPMTPALLHAHTLAMAQSPAYSGAVAAETAAAASPGGASSVLSASRALPIIHATSLQQRPGPVPDVSNAAPIPPQHRLSGAQSGQAEIVSLSPAGSGRPIRRASIAARASRRHEDEDDDDDDAEHSQAGAGMVTHSGPKALHGFEHTTEGTGSAGTAAAPPPLVLVNNSGTVSVSAAPHALHASGKSLFRAPPHASITAAQPEATASKHPATNSTVGRSSKSASLPRARAAPGSRVYSKRQPVPEDFDNPEDYQRAWRRWRQQRDENNAAVRRCRGQAASLPQPLVCSQSGCRLRRQYVTLAGSRADLIMRALWRPDTVQPSDAPLLDALRTAWTQTLAASNGDLGPSDPIPGMDQVVSMAMATGASLGLPTAVSLLGSVQEPPNVSMTQAAQDPLQPTDGSALAAHVTYTDDASARQSEAASAGAGAGAIAPGKSSARTGFKPVASRGSAESSGLAALGRAALKDELHAAAGQQPSNGASTLALRSGVHPQPQPQDEQPAPETATGASVDPDHSRQSDAHLGSQPVSRPAAKRKASEVDGNNSAGHSNGQDASDREQEELEIDESEGSHSSPSDAESSTTDDGGASQS